jgi:hypothetical protein
MFGFDEALRSINSEFVAEGVAVMIEKLLLEKISAITDDDYSAFAKAFASHTAKAEATEFDFDSFPGAKDLFEQFELTDEDQDGLDTKRDMLLATVKNTVTKAVEELGASVFRKLKMDWPARDRAENFQASGFKLRQDELWGDAFSSLRMLLLCCREIGGERLSKVEQAQQRTALDWALVRLHARGCLVASEISTLCENGHAHGAMARWRTLYEIEVVALALFDGGNELAKRFIDHAVITTERGARAYDAQAATLGYRPISKRERQKIQTRYNKILKQYGKYFCEGDYGWAIPLFANNKRPNLYNVAEYVSKHKLSPFVKLAHQSVHGGSQALFFNIGLLEQDEILLAGASNAGHADPIQLTANSLVSLTAVLLRDEPASADAAAVIKALSLIAAQASKSAMLAHKTQKRNHFVERAAQQPVAADSNAK